TREHGLSFDVAELGTSFVTDVLFFGVIGPTAVLLVLSYIMRLLRWEVSAADKLKALNQNLGKMVNDRTEALASRNEELAAANAALQKLDQMKSDFVSLVSHELRAPLTTLNGGLEMALHEAGDMSPQTRRIIEVMARESDRLTHLVKTILDVSQLDAGHLALNLGPVAVVPLLKRTAEVLFPNGDQPIFWRTAPGLPPLWADEVYIEEILRNLLRNAQKYSPPSSPIELETVLIGDDCLSISITDQGPGIPKDQQGLIFDRFYRRAKRDNPATPGWGLGLYFARALAQEHGGSLGVISPVNHSETNPGSRFTLILPVTAEVPDDVETAAD
ncbi:MAG: sensor histidine kinase, partial [Anaerolineae bacterium]